MSEYILIYREVMCGRMFQTLSLRRLLQIARTNNVSNSEMYSSSYNICPTTYIPVIKKCHLYPDKSDHKKTSDKRLKADQHEEQQVCESIQNQECELKQQGECEPKQNMESEQKQNEECETAKPDREVAFMRWGQKTNFNLIINGRIEEMTEKRTFLKLIENRCVVIMQGYYEWKQKSQPFCFKSKTSDHFLVAGLFTDQNQTIILTKDAIPSLSQIHQRMPVILSQKQVQLWLDPNNTKDLRNIIQKSLLDKDKSIWKNIGFAQLAPYVNKRDQKTNKCLTTIEQYKKQLSRTGLMRFWGKKDKPKTQQQSRTEEKSCGLVEQTGKDGEILVAKDTIIQNNHEQHSPISKTNVLQKSSEGNRDQP